MSDHPETGEQAWSARDEAAGQRDDIAGQRDVEAAARDLLADERDQLADRRDAELDEWELRLGRPDQGTDPAAEPGRNGRDRAALARADARRERELKGAERDVAAAARDQASQGRLAGLSPAASGVTDHDERSWAADKRDFVADDRDDIADARDSVADARDVLADEREQLADAREAELDERERRLNARDAEPGPASGVTSSGGRDEQQRARLLRQEARQERERRRTARDGALADRDQARQRRQAATPATGLALAFADIARQLYEAGTIDDALARIAETCVATVPGCQMASITIRGSDDRFQTVTSTDQAAKAADQAQYEASEGPCLTALGEAIVYTPEFPDPRWPALGSGPATAGVQSGVSYGLAASGPASRDSRTGSLNAYAGVPHAFDDEAREIGLILAAHASVAVRAVGERQASGQLGRQLHEALSSRDVIGQAKGILMERLRIAPDDAFDVLRRSSQRLNVKLRDIAQKLAETGEIDHPDGS